LRKPSKTISILHHSLIDIKDCLVRLFYRNLLTAFKHDAEREYKQIAEIVEEYKFKDPKVKVEADKLLQTTRRHYMSLDNELKSLEKGGGIVASSGKRR
jgi:hypothetical protein